jgi:hypothetical protein
LVAGLYANYQYVIQRIYDLSSNTAYLVVGRPNGTGRAGAVFGPGSICQALVAPDAGYNITFQVGRLPRTLTGCETNSIGFMVNAEQMIINEDLAFVFETISTT